MGDYGESAGYIYTKKSDAAINPRQHTHKTGYSQERFIYFKIGLQKEMLAFYAS